MVSKRTAAILLGVIVVIAAGVRVIGIDAKSLWGDELWTVVVSMGRGINGGLDHDAIVEPPVERVTRLEGALPIRELWDVGPTVTQPPLYFVVLRIWCEMFGDSDVVLRSLSILFSLVSVVLIYDVGRMLAGRTAGLWAAALLALATPQVLYALEVRNYTIQYAIALAAASILLRIERSGASWLRLVGFGTAVLALVLSHYFSLGVVIALGLYALLRLRKSDRVRTVAAMVVAAGVFAGLWGPAMLGQGPKFSAAENMWLFDLRPYRWLRALDDSLLAPAKLITRLNDMTLGIGYLIGFAVLGLVLLWRRRPELQLPLLWLFCGIGLLTVLDMARSSIHLTFIRYSTLSGIGIYLLLAVVLAPWRGLRHVVPAAACGWCLLALPAVYAGPYEKWQSGFEDWRIVAAILAEYAQPHDLIVFSAENRTPFFAHVSMLGTSHYSGTIHCPIVVATRRADEKLLADIAGRRPRFIWVVVTDASSARPEAFIPGIQLHEVHVVPFTANIWRASWSAPAAQEPPKAASTPE